MDYLSEFGERLKFGSCAEACNKGGEGPSKEMREEKNVEEGGKTECEEERKKGYEGGGGWVGEQDVACTKKRQCEVG